MNNNFKPFIALPYSAKLKKNLEFKNINISKQLFNNIINKKDINTVNSVNSVNSMNKDNSSQIQNNKESNEVIKSFDNNYMIDIKENTGLLSNENQCKYCCYDINSNINFFKKIFLSNEINFDKN